MAIPQRQSDATLRRACRTGQAVSIFSRPFTSCIAPQAGSGAKRHTGPYRDGAGSFRHSPRAKSYAGDIEGTGDPKKAVRSFLTSTFLGLYGAASPLAIPFPPKT